MPKKAVKKRPISKQTPSITEEQLDELRDLMPQVINEGRIDFDKLRASLGDFADERPEHYSFTWAGKRDAIRILQTPSRATLVPARKESIDFNNTQNVFIEGENLEALKLLYKAYFGKVKMIYIDPPYNTGNDFVYPDNFADPLDTYLKLTGQKDSEGNLLTSNAETSGRYHSAWLSMMYPRLFVARQLLREDGVIFISIDDHEVHNLRLIMNEIFGEESFLACFIWQRRQMADSRNQDRSSTDHEYVVAYKNNKAVLRGKDIDLEKYSNPDNDTRGAWFSADITGLATKERRPNLHYDVVNPKTRIVYHPSSTRGWSVSKETFNNLIEEGRILWPNSPDGRPRRKKFLNEVTNFVTGLSTILKVGFTTEGTREIQELFGDKIIQFPKPISLIKTLIQQTTQGDLVLDFFAGSCTTAQAVLELNREDGGNRKFIMVQLPEPTDNKKFPTIAEIGKERIRRVVKKMKNEFEGQLPLDKPEDLGFKVFKLHESNYKQWESEKEKDPKVYAKQLEMLSDPLVESWKAENVIYEVALKEGYSLNIQLKDTEVKGVQQVSDPQSGQSFYICLEEKIRLRELKPLNLSKDDLFICRDIALNDEAAANLALQCRLKTI